MRNGSRLNVERRYSDCARRQGDVKLHAAHQLNLLLVLVCLVVWDLGMGGQEGVMSHHSKVKVVIDSVLIKTNPVVLCVGEEP